MAVQKKVVRSASKAAPAKTNRKVSRQVEEEEEAAPARRSKKAAAAAPVKTTRAERVAAREAAKAAQAKAERIAAKKAAAAKPAKKAKPAPEPEVVESSQQILLTYTAEITGKKVTMTDTTYVIDGVEILRAQVVVMIGKTFFYRKTINLGTVADSALVKGLTCVNTEEGDKVVLFDPSVVQFLEVEGGGEVEADEEVDEEVDGEDGDTDGDDEDDDDTDGDDEDGDDDDDDTDGDDDDDTEGDDDEGGDDEDGDDFEF